MIINNRPVEKVESYIYLGQKIEITRNNLTADLSRRISLAWSAFGRMQDVFKSDIPNTIKARVFDQYVQQVLTYETETWALNKKIINSYTGSHGKTNSKHQPTKPHYQQRNKKKKQKFKMS